VSVRQRSDAWCFEQGTVVESMNSESRVRYTADLSMVSGLALAKASTVLADALRAGIASGQWDFGDALPSETQLGTITGFSRATIREALRLLEAEGLIAIRRGPMGGIKVTKPDLSQIARSLAFLIMLDEVPLRSLFEYRRIAEPVAARLAAERASDEERQELMDLATSSDPAGYRFELAFHAVLARCAGNELLRAMLVVPNELLQVHLRGEDISLHDVEHAASAHRQIAQAIVAGNGTRAEHVMTRHLESFEKLMDDHDRLEEPIVPRNRWGQSPFEGL
jgi:GntR family transcriptional regulator, transcriptional repressor for pyruvate dehydrogenase complex